MGDGTLIAAVSFGYLALLFAIAYVGDQRADAGKSLIANPWTYALSLAVYCTTWTFYGSVGRAAATGIGFLPIYLGPTLAAALWWFLLRKMVRISRTHRITSIADFIASRHGKSPLLGGLVTVIAVTGVVPYIALQLKAVAASVGILLGGAGHSGPDGFAGPLDDHALYIALILAAFTILFGTRHLDATERHEGMVAAIAFESIVKLVSFVVVGAFVTWGIYDGVGDIFARAAAEADLRALMGMTAPSGGYAGWASLTLLSFFAILFLPRQFQIAVVENVDERHIAKAMWIFPLYLLVINLFVLPIAFGGLLLFKGGQVDADTFVLTLPLHEGWHALAFFVFLGGLSAATGMVIVETIALSTMVCNDLVMPVLLRLGLLASGGERDLSRMLLAIRRGAIVLVLLLGYLYFRLAGEAYALVSIGLISFAAVAQFAPAMLGGMYWKGGTRNGALAGLTAGFAVWTYTLLLPSFARSGWLPMGFVEGGPFGIALLRPQALFGLDGMDQITHTLFWSLLVNAGAYFAVPLFVRPDAAETAQALRFVDVYTRAQGDPRLWRGRASMESLVRLLRRFLGAAHAEQVLSRYRERRGRIPESSTGADAEFVHFAETELAGAIGAASARAVVATVVQEEPLAIEDIMRILEETSEALAHSRALEQKSRELEAATAKLTEANARLQELDRLKDEFVSTVSHELRTPLTSIRAFAEILFDHPETDAEERGRFLGIILKESERLTRLINDLLDFAKLESGQTEWRITTLDVRDVVADAVAASAQLFRDRVVALEVDAVAGPATVRADPDRLMQVLINLLSNAAKFSPAGSGRVRLSIQPAETGWRVDVADNGPGIAVADQALIFERFRQVGGAGSGRPAGTGLGLPISRHIIEHFGGRLWVESRTGEGATFSFVLPSAAGEAATMPGGAAAPAR